MWFVVTHTFKLYVSYSRMGARQRSCLVKKKKNKTYGVWTPGALQLPGLLPLKFKRPRMTLQSADLLHKMEEAAATTKYTNPLSSCHDSDTEG